MSEDRETSTLRAVAVWDSVSAALPALLRQLGRLRVQVAGALILAVAAPVFLRWGGDPEGILMPLQVNTIIASGIAVTIGLLMLRQLGDLPGVNEDVYLLPILLLSYLAVMAVLLFFRIEYNRYLFPVSLGLTAVWVLLARRVARQHMRHRLAIVPGGAVDGLTAIKGVEWRQLWEPDLQSERFDGVVADLREDLDPEWERFIADCAISGIRVFHVKQIRESMTGRLEIEHLSENTLGSINPDGNYLKLKALLDWFLAALFLVVFWPLLAIVALMVKLDSPGPALFRQERMGFRGQSFRVFKFRTMRADASAATVTSAMTADDDPRITRLGRFLRRSRIDELPQVLNILRGEMSWIGPRPEAVALSRWYEQQLPFYRYRHIVRPGISGWAQINQGHVTAVDDVHEKLHYDFYYIKNFSPWLDTLIVLRTLQTILTGFGAR